MDYSKIDDVIRHLLKLHEEEKRTGSPSEYHEPMLAIGSEGGRVIESIVKVTRPLRGLEIGTSSGFSALCALRGAMDGDFRLTTVDFDAKKADWARQNFEEAGVADRVEIIVDDGLKAALRVGGRFDYVLLDAAKKQNLPILQALMPKLNYGAVILTDNAVTHSAEMQDYFQFVRHHDELVSGLWEIGNGIEVTMKLLPRISDRIIHGDMD